MASLIHRTSERVLIDESKLNGRLINLEAQVFKLGLDGGSSYLEKCKKDKDAKYRLILVESKIHRLGRYYRRTKRLPNKWRYNAKTASTMVSA